MDDLSFTVVLFYNPKSISMKKVLPPRALCFTVVFSLLLLSFQALAGNSPEKSLSTLKKKTQIIHAELSLAAPVDVQVNTDPWSNEATNVSLGTPVVSIDSEVTYAVTNNAPAGYPIGVTEVLWTVTDADGNSATAIQKVTVTDNEKPHISRRQKIGVVNDPGQCGAVVKLMPPSVFDNSYAPVTLTHNGPVFFPVGSLRIIWTATDIYGNSDTSTQMITVIDNELPTISTTDIQVSSEPGKCGAAVNLGTPVAADNCGVVTISNDAPAFFPTGTTLVHWTVTDKVGYTNTTTQTVVVTDNESPVIVSPASITVNNTPGKCGANLVLTAPAVSDNCGVAGITGNAPAFFPTGSTVVTWTAIDINGNQSSATQTITVKDVEAPVLAGIPANVIVSCGSIPALPSPTATDNCTTSPSISFSQVSTQSSDVTKSASYNYTITRTWIAKDAGNNTSSGTQVITVQDKTAPVITVPLNISVGNSLNVCGATVNYTVSASDNCGSPVTFTYSKTSGSVFSSGTTTVTVTAKDASGNTSTKSFTVTVTDTQKPSVTAPSDISTTVTTSSSKATVNIGTPLASDNCGVQTITNNAPSSYPVGTTTVTWTVKDAKGNTSTDTQIITVSVKKKSSNAVIPAAEKATDEAPEELKITVAPNPSPAYFTIKLESRSDAPVNLRVTDAGGRVVDAKAKIGVNTTLQVGHNYLPGTYFAEFTQANQRKTIQLMKIK
jgi:hypothetical protein